MKIGILATANDEGLPPPDPARRPASRGAGPEHEVYNNQPLFRCNAYFGIHTVYFLDLVEHTGRQALPMGGVVAASPATTAARVAAGSSRGCKALNPWTRTLISAMGNLKFAACVALDGCPRVVPILQAQAASRDRIIFSPMVYGDDLAAIPVGASLAVFGMTLKMEDVLMRGRCVGMPGRIYPPVGLEAVREFD